MTRQGIFKHVVEFMRKQGKRAVSEPSTTASAPGELAPYNGCLYAAPDGSKCAIGCLPTFPSRLKDSHGGVYQLIKQMTGQEVMYLLPRDALVEDAESFLADVQDRLHDRLSVSFLEQLETAAQGFAREHELIYEPPKGVVA